jgi:hypothetical protein
VKVKNRLDATKYAVLLSQHVSVTNMPIISSTISEYLPLLDGHTWKAVRVLPHWDSWSERYSEVVLPSKHPILHIFSTNIRTEFFKHVAHSPFFLFKMPFIS